MINTLCLIFSYAAEAVILWQYASGLFVPLHTRRRRLSTLIICHCLSLAVSLFENIWLNAVLFVMSCFIFMIQYQIKWYLALFHSVMLTIFMGLSELIPYSILSFFIIHLHFESNDAFSLITFAGFSKLIYFFLTYILMNFFEEKGGKNKVTAILLSLIPIISLFLVITLMIISGNTQLPAYLNWMIAISAIFLLAINLLVFGMHQYTQKKDLEFTQMQLLLQEESNFSEYYKMLLSQKENQSILIHDIKKHLQSITLLNDKGESDKIDTYIRQLLHSSDLNETARFCDHDLLNAVLYQYQRRCQEENIDFHTDIRSKTTTFLSDYDLTSLFGNLLDNALEAAAQVPHAYIEISACRKENAPFVVVTVVNSCPADPFLGTSGRLVSPKPDSQRHGFGIKSIQRIVSRYGGEMQMYYQDETHTFHVILTLHVIS